MKTVDVNHEKIDNYLASSKQQAASSKQQAASSKQQGFTPYNTSCMKGTAILLVVLCHFVGTFFEGRIVYFTPLGGIGVSIFLMLSAYGLNESYKKHGLTNWWRKRLIAVWMPYLIVQCCLYWPFHEWNSSLFLKDVTFLDPLYQNGWYLNYLAVCYILFYLVVRIPFTREHKIIFWGIISAIFFFTLPEIRAEQSLSFLVGLVLSEKKEYIRKLNWKTGSVFIIFSVVFLALKQTDMIRNGSQMMYNFIQLMIKLPCGMGICGCILSLGKKLSLKLLDLVGKESYELYLVHGYVLSAVSISISGAIIFVCVSAMASVVLGYCCSRLKKFLYGMLCRKIDIAGKMKA